MYKISKKNQKWFLSANIPIILILAVFFYDAGATTAAFGLGGVIAGLSKLRFAAAYAATFFSVGAVCIGVTDTYQTGFAFAFAVPICIGIMLFLEYADAKAGSLRFDLIFTIVLLFFSGLVVFIFSNFSNWQPGFSGALIIMLVVVPIINATFDFGSLALTRSLLARSLRAQNTRKILLYSGLDGLAAAGILWGLCFALPFCVQSINALADLGGGEMQMDVGNILRSINGTGTLSGLDLAWVYLMVLSTFIPTLIHFSLALAAIVTGGRYPQQKSIVLRYIKAAENHNYKMRHRAARALADIELKSKFDLLTVMISSAVILFLF